MDTIRIMFADDDVIIRTGMEMILETQEDFQVVAVCSSGEEAIRVCENSDVDVAILDIRMPGINGIEAAKAITANETTKILLLTTFDEPDLITEAVKAEVHGYILKSSSAETILSAIRAVYQGGTVFQKDVMDYITNHMTQALGNTDMFAELTERELEVAKLIAEGLTNKEIGERLFISDGTVRNHITTILSKTDLKHRTQIAIQYIYAFQS